MDHRQFQEWLSRIDQPGPAQRQQAEAGLSGGSEASASLAAIEDSVGEGRRCPHCGTPGAISRGKARGLRRYQCKGCRKTFNAATGTPCRACTARTGGLPLEPVLPMGRRFVLRQNVAGLPSIPPSVGGTAFSPQKTRKHAGSRALWKLMKPVFCKAKRANETLRARRAAGEARPPNEVCRMNRFRSWLPLTAAGRQSVWFCLRSMSIRCGLLSNRSWTRISFW